MEMAQREEKPCQDKMKENWNCSAKPSLVWMKRHSDDVSEEHGDEVNIAEPQNKLTHGSSLDHEETISPGKVAAYLNLEN